MVTVEKVKNAEKFICDNCHFKCCKLSNYTAHLLTKKHIKIQNWQTVVGQI